MVDWETMSADDWAELGEDVLEEIEMDELPLMALAKRVAELSGLETRELLDSRDGDVTDTVEWRGRVGDIPIRFELPGLVMQAKVRAGELLYLWLDKAPQEGRGGDWASDDERYVKVHERIWALEHLVPLFRAFPKELQHDIAAGMEQHAIRTMGFDDDDGVEIELPFNHFQSLADPVRQIAGALTFLARTATALQPDDTTQKGQELP